MKNRKVENRTEKPGFNYVSQPGMIMMDPVDAPGEEFVFRGLMKIIRKAQRSKNPAVAAIGDEYAEFARQVRDGRRRVEQIACAMR